MTSSKGGVLVGLLVALSFPLPSRAAQSKAAPARLTAKQIAEKHLQARGGIAAWQGVQSMVWSGKMEVGYGDSKKRSIRYVSTMEKKNNGARAVPAPVKGEAEKQVQVPFAMEMKRPDKTRIEIEFAGKKAVQVYDGTSGWLKRPYLNRDDWEPFTAEQTKSQEGKWEMGGPLIDYAAKGTKVELVSVEPVGGRDAYKLKLTEKSGQVKHVWIDAKSFLDVKVEGIPRRMDGKERTVWVTQTDFHSVHGLMVPYLLETAVEGSPDTHKMTIEKVALNPQLDDARFAKPKA